MVGGGLPEIPPQKLAGAVLLPATGPATHGEALVAVRAGRPGSPGWRRRGEMTPIVVFSPHLAVCSAPAGRPCSTIRASLPVQRSAKRQSASAAACWPSSPTCRWDAAPVMARAQRSAGAACCTLRRRGVALAGRLHADGARAGVPGVQLRDEVERFKASGGVASLIKSCVRGVLCSIASSRTSRRRPRPDGRRWTAPRRSAARSAPRHPARPTAASIACRATARRSQRARKYRASPGREASATAWYRPRRQVQRCGHPRHRPDRPAQPPTTTPSTSALLSTRGRAARRVRHLPPLEEEFAAPQDSTSRQSR